MNTKIVIANWKANPATLDEAQEIFGAAITSAKKYEKIKTIICPPFVFLEELAKLVYFYDNNQPVNTFLGAQDIFWGKTGPYTGEIPAEMLRQFGVSHVLIGHSDRRYTIGESDEVINKKIKAALGAEITPILLVGEKERTDAREDVLVDQLSRDLEGISPDQITNILIAYEPVWAISTQKDSQPDTPESALEAVKIIKKIIAKNYKIETINCLYGGSVNENNVDDYLKYPEMVGAVIGGASLRKDEFGGILKVVSEIE